MNYLLICLLFSFNLIAATTGLKKTPELEMGKNYFPPEHMGYSVIDLETGEIVKAHNPKQVFVPASVSKLPTMIYALETLGSIYRFKTIIKCEFRAYI